MLYLFRCLMISGYLHSNDGFVEVLRHACAIIVPEPLLREYLLKKLDGPMAIPSPTTLYRHRLTVHIGWCLWMSALQAAILHSEFGIARFGRVDRTDLDMLMPQQHALSPPR